MPDRLEKVAKELSSDFSSLREDVRRLTSLVADLANEGADQSRSSVHGAVDRVRDQFSSAADRFSTAADRVASQASDARDRVRGASAELEARIEKNPLTAVMIAIVGGLIIGALSRSRR